MTFYHGPITAYGTSEGVTKGNLKRGANPYGEEAPVKKSAKGTKSDIRTWENLPKFTPLPKVAEVAQRLGLKPDWRSAPGNWTSQRVIGKSLIVITPRDAQDLGTQLHELGHEYWDIKMPNSGKDASRRLLQWARNLPVWGKGTVQNPDSRFRELSNGEVINVQHGHQRAHEELFTQLFSLHYQGKLGGDIETAMNMLMKMK